MFYLADKWRWQGDVLSALGVDNPHRGDDVLDPPQPIRRAPAGAARAAEIRKFVAMAGGE